MRTRIVKIGNLLGVRTRKCCLNKAGWRKKLKLKPFDRQIVIRAVHEPRDGWDAAFKAMSQNGDDKLLDAEEAHSLSSWDETEWQW